MNGMRCTVISMAVGFLLVSVPPLAAQYREVEVTGAAVIGGRVQLVGEAPKLPQHPVFKHKQVCGASIPDERLVLGKDAGLVNAVVYLEGIKEGKPIHWDQKVALDNSKCRFVPHVLTATVGQMLEIHNSDPFLHDAHALLGSRTLFNVAVPKGRTVHRPLAYSGIVQVNCNVRHTWMKAYIFVGDHPYHTVTNDKGEFTLTDVPPGTYTLSVWHELLGSEDRKVTVEANKKVTVDFSFDSNAGDAKGD